MFANSLFYIPGSRVCKATHMIIIAGEISESEIDEKRWSIKLTYFSQLSEQLFRQRFCRESAKLLFELKLKNKWMTEWMNEWMNKLNN